MSKINFLLFLSILFFAVHAHGQFLPGQDYFGTNGYIEYYAGDLPIIISAPHGGYLEPASIPDRNCSSCVTVRDGKTEEMIYQLDSAIQILFGRQPHIIINKLARVKLDANREIVEAAQGNPAAETAWQEYHTFVQAAKDSARNRFGTALYIDLHAHGHSIQRIEYGYLITRSELQNSDAILDFQHFQDSSSIKHLVNVQNPGVGFSELLRGNECMGEFLVEHGYPGTPSASDPAPAPSDPFFNGGYNTVRHGSRDSSDINGIQFELNYSGIRDNDANIAAFSRAMACAIRDYLDRWFFDLDAWTPGHLVTSTADHGPGSLRDVLLGAEDGTVITFDPALQGDTIRLEKELRLCTEVNIQGPGADLLAVSGGDSVRLGLIMPTDSVSISGLSMVSGRSAPGTDGGGFLVEGAMRMVNCRIAANHGDDDGGAFAIRDGGRLYLDSCTIEDNTCGDDGAGIRNFQGSLNMQRSTLSNNVSPSFGGGISSNGTVSIIQSTFKENTADGNGGGIRSFGGVVEIENSTFWGNDANRGGGISASTAATLNHCTLMNNAATSEGGGIRMDGDTATLENSLVANNAAPLGPDLGTNGGIYLSNGYNFISDTTASNWLPQAGDQLGNTNLPLDPVVQSLDNNGGPTETVALDLGGPCIDLANPGSVLTSDQRGESRPDNGRSDIGAFEYQTPVGIEGADLPAVNIYPNPAHDQLTIDFGEVGDYAVKIVNLLGQTMWESRVEGVQQAQLNVARWPSGAYWIRIQGNLEVNRLFQVHQR